MPKFSTMKTVHPVKLLIVGEPKAGKTSSLVSLVKNGQRLFIQNFDGDTHMAPFGMYLTPEEQERVVVETFKDDLGLKNGRVMPTKPPTAFPSAMKMLDRWKDAENDYGSVHDWGTDTTVVLDTITSMGKAAMWYRLFTNGRFNVPAGKPIRRQKDWGEAMELQESFLDMLLSDTIKCNVVVLAHLTTVGDSGGDDDDDDEDFKPGAQPKLPAERKTIDWKRYPSALGKKLPPKVSGMFGAVIEAKSIGGGRNTRKVLRTVPEADVDIAVPALGLPPEIELEGGLWRIFEAIRNGKDMKVAA